MMQDFSNREELAAWLAQRGIDTAVWGTGGAKSVANLWGEIQRGEVKLQSRPPLRRVAVVQVVIRRGDCVLLEVEQELANGRRRARNRLPSEKLQPGESPQQAAARCLQEELGLESEAFALLDEAWETAVVERASPSYPGLPSQYTVYTVAAAVEQLPREPFWRDNLGARAGDPVRRHRWAWRPARTLTMLGRDAL